MRETITKCFALALGLTMLAATMVILVHPQSSRAAAKKFGGPALSYGPFMSTGGQFCTINWGDATVTAALIVQGAPSVSPTAVSSGPGETDVTLSPATPWCAAIGGGSPLSVLLVLPSDDALGYVTGTWTGTSGIPIDPVRLAKVSVVLP
jgi:hypothetical protein